MEEHQWSPKPHQRKHKGPHSPSTKFNPGVSPEKRCAKHNSIKKYLECLVYISLQLVTSARDSAVRLGEWVDLIVQTESSSSAFVKDSLGGKVQGLYHNLKANEAASVEAAISMFSTWTSDCTNNGLSAGLFISICGAGKGLCQGVPKKSDTSKTNYL